MTTTGGVKIRPATKQDAGAILSMIRELADFENEPDAVKASEEDIARTGWGERSYFDALMAENQGGSPVGFALYYRTYSTWEGRHGIFVEDLFVKQSARGLGIGKLLLTAVAQVARDEGCVRLELNVLHWNPARDFYHRIGFQHLDEWLPYRLEGEGISHLAESA